MSVDYSADFVKSHSVTSDRFLGGRLIILQPKSGFRAGTDSVLLGASVSPEARTLLDLGAGCGVAGLAALSHSPELRADFVERDPQIAALCAQNVNANSFTGRCGIFTIDVTASGKARVAAGIAANHYDSVIANPPFFPKGSGTEASDPGRAGARTQPQDHLEKWVRCAAASACAGAEVIFLFPASGLGALLGAFEGRFGAVTIQPIAPRPGRETGRILIKGTKGSRAPGRLLAPIYLHDNTGHENSAEIRRVTLGETRLNWNLDQNAPR